MGLTSRQERVQLRRAQGVVTGRHAVALAHTHELFGGPILGQRPEGVDVDELVVFERHGPVLVLWRIVWHDDATGDLGVCAAGATHSIQEGLLEVHCK